MAELNSADPAPRVLVIADVESNAKQIVERVLRPADIEAWPVQEDAPSADMLLVDVTLFRGDPLSGLRARREAGDMAPAIVLAAHFPAARLRGLFRLGVRDILLKPYRPEELIDAIRDLTATHAAAGESTSLVANLEGAREDVRRRSEEIRMLSEIGRVVASLDDLDEILTRLVEAAAYVTDAEEASIYLADPETNAVVLRASKEPGDRNATLQRLRVDDTLVGQVFQTGQPVLRQADDETGPFKIQTGFMVRSLIKVPVRMRQDVVGVLGVYNRMAARSFNEHHVVLLLALADWAGLALERSSLVQQAGSEALADQPVFAAPPDLVEGLDRVINNLRSFADGSSEPLSEIQKAQVRQMGAQLGKLRQLPITTLEPEAAGSLVDLQRLVKRAVAEHQLMAARRGLNLIVETETPVALFAGDSRRVYQVIEALVAAAIRRTSAGRVLIQAHRFQVQDGRSEGLLLPTDLVLQEGAWSGVSVADSSSGLSPDTVRALTAAELDPEAGKVGPGLSMGEIRMIVESMGGRLWYQETPASTNITFALPSN